ncbi:hypothetical protein ACU8OR_23195 [Rhizobium leguminosarum]
MLQTAPITHYERRESQQIFLAWLCSMPIYSLIILYGNSLSASLPPAIIVILGAVLFLSLGFCLYLIRMHFRVVYGLAEITFAVFTALIAMGEHLNYTSILWWLPLSNAGFIGKIFAAYYVAVRALDNVANGLKEHEDYHRKNGNERWERFWKRAVQHWSFITFRA